ncbi:hypothetical protein N5P37_012259, partial [Trichoderma harzianum]
IGGQLAQLFGWIGSLQVSRWWLRSSVGGSVCVHKSWDEPSHIRNAGLAVLHLYRASKDRGYIPLVHTGCTWANLAECQWSWRHEETLNGGYFLKLLGLQAEVERGGPRRCFQTSVKRRETATTCMKVSRPRAHKVLVINILRAPYSQVIASQGLISLASQ